MIERLVGVYLLLLVSECNADILNREERYPYTLTAQYYLAEVATKAEIEVVVTQEDFERALKNLVPSVSETEMKHYARIRQRFSEN